MNAKRQTYIIGSSKTTNIMAIAIFCK